MKPIGSALVRGIAAAVVALVLATGCTSNEEKLANHLERADAHVAKGDDKAAVIELMNALRLAPQNGAINLRMADVMSRQGKQAEALFYYEESFRLDPTLDAGRLGAALVLGGTDAPRARALIDEVIERDPGNAKAHAVLANLLMMGRNVDDALAPALMAAQLAPDDPDVQLQLGRTYQAKIQTIQNSRQDPPAEAFQSALGAFDRALASAGDDVYVATQAAFERARVLASWPGHVPETHAAYLDLIARVKTSTDPQLVQSALQVAMRFAQLSKDPAVFRSIAEKAIETDPRYLPAWVQLAVLEQREGRTADPVFERLLRELPRDAQAYIARADYLRQSGRGDEAVSGLRDAIGKVDEPFVVRGALVDTLYEFGRADEAVAAIAEMESADPEHVETRFAVARRAMREGRFADAAAVLEPLAAKAEQLRVLQMLAEARLRLGDLPAATKALDRAIAAAPPGWAPGMALRLAILRASRDYEGVLRTAKDLQRAGTELTPEQRVAVAEALYETGRAENGEELLKKVLAAPDPPLRARVVYARREGSRDPAAARAVLEQGLAASPDSWPLLQELAILDSLSGDPKAAIVRLDAAIAAGGADAETASLRAIRARLRAQAGDTAGAEEDALAAFRAAPNLPGAAALVATLAVPGKHVPESIALFEASPKSTALGDPARTVLARLYIAAGRDDDAAAILEEIVKAGGPPVAKNDLAYLLAKQKRDLDRAVTLAQEALAAVDNASPFADTLGYAYLQKGLFGPALAQFDLAINLANQEAQPRAEYHFRRGLALQGLERADDALKAFDAALALDPGFSEAQKARATLQATMSAERQQPS